MADRGSEVAEPMGLASGDFVFVGDLGRPDLLESAAGQVGVMRPAAHTLYRSLQGFLDLPDYLQVWPGHGAGSACGKALGAVPGSTVGYERRFNAAIQVAAQGEESFVDSILEGQPEPPMYFARMKRLNKVGPPVLGSLPRPKPLAAADLIGLSGRQDVVVLDARPEASQFMGGHLPGALYAPMDKSFPTVVGSYVEPGTPLYLIIDTAEVENAVRELVRIGLDEIVGFATPVVLAEYSAGGGTLQRIQTIDFARLYTMVQPPVQRTVQVLDVRGLAEHSAGHVPGSMNIAHTRLLVRKDEVPSGTVVVHCASGQRAAVASALLQRLGHDVVCVADDFVNWPQTEAVGA